MRIYQPTAHIRIVYETLDNGEGAIFKVTAKDSLDEIRGKHFDPVIIKFTQNIGVIVKVIAKRSRPFGSQSFDVCGSSGF